MLKLPEASLKLLANEASAAGSGARDAGLLHDASSVRGKAKPSQVKPAISASSLQIPLVRTGSKHPLTLAVPVRTLTPLPIVMDPIVKAKPPMGEAVLIGYPRKVIAKWEPGTGLDQVLELCSKGLPGKPCVGRLFRDRDQTPLLKQTEPVSAGRYVFAPEGRHPSAERTLPAVHIQSSGQSTKLTIAAAQA